MITEKDFRGLLDDKDAAFPCFELAKKMAFEYHKFATDYHRIEGQNISYNQRKRGLGMISWIGADNNKIFDAYLKGEQLQLDWLKDLGKNNNLKSEQ